MLDTTPWADEIIEALNTFQRKASYHPYTCGGDRMDATHRVIKESFNLPDYGLLVATKDGWICPACNYTQKWYSDSMVEIGQKILNGELDPLNPFR